MVNPSGSGLGERSHRQADNEATSPALAGLVVFVLTNADVVSCLGVLTPSVPWRHMRSLLQLFAIILFVLPAIAPPALCVCWPLAIVLLAIDRSLGNQEKMIKLQQSAAGQPTVQTASASIQHWSKLERYISPRCGIYRIRQDPRTFVDARGELVQHESADALRVDDPLSVRTVWPDGEDRFVVGVFFENKMIGVLPPQLEGDAREMLANPNIKIDASARVFHIDMQARDAVILGFFNLLASQPAPRPAQMPTNVADDIKGGLSRLWEKHPVLTMTAGAIGFAGICAYLAWLAVKHWM